MATASCSSFGGSASAITNYARLCIATQHELPHILRKLLITKESPHLLEAHINKNRYLSKKLKASDWDIIRTVGKHQYGEFDVALMYKIIRNLNLVPTPTKGWNSQTPPLSTEITVGDDIERIRRIRNGIVHRGNINVQGPELAKYFSVFKDLANRLEIYLKLSNKEFVSKIEKLEICCIDNATQQRYISRLKELAENETQIAKNVAKVQKDLACLGLKISKFKKEIEQIKLEQMEVILKNVRDQMLKDLEIWLQDDTKFVPTTASEYVFSSLKKENCVTVVGRPGVGKTAITRHVALKMKEKQYTVIPITVPTDIRDFYQPGQQTVFVIDDMCGNFSAKTQLIDNWKQLLGVIDKILADNCKIIVSCRSQVYQDNKFNALPQFKSYQCNLISKDLLLSKDERIQIAKAHLGELGNDIPEALLLQYDFFPLLCFLYISRKENTDIIEFFNNPFVVFEKELNSLWNEGETGQSKICVLALCVIYNNKLDERDLTSMEPCVRDLIDDVCEACGINRGTSRIKIKEELDTLVGTYLKKENNVYIIIHDKLFDFLVYFYGKKMLDCLIKHADIKIINERFHCNKLRIKDDRDTNEFINIIPDDKLTLYLNRLILDWSNGKFIDMFSNNFNMKHEQFSELLLTQLMHRDEATQSQLSRITEIYNGIKIGALETCCSEGYHNLLKWFVDQGVEVNQCSTGFLTPLAAACCGNKIEIIKTLLNLEADINKPGKLGYTPLHLSCSKEVWVDQALFDLLLKNGACINQRMYDGSTPLLLALYENNRKAVKVLLSHSADCNIGFYNSQAIRDGFMEVGTSLDFSIKDNEFHLTLIWWQWFRTNCPSSVVEYVQQEPGTELLIVGGATPLHLTCFTNDIDMIRLLLEKNPDINIRKEDGSTPLFVACQFGFIDIAKILLEHDANIDIYRNDGTSPLEMAKQRNHTEIISLLKKLEWKLVKSKKIKKKRKGIVS